MAVAQRARPPPTSRPSRGCPGSRRTSRRRGRASRGSRSAATPHFCAHPGVVVDEVAAPVPEHDPVVDDELGHVLVGRADDDPLDARVGREPPGGRPDGVVGLELDHRPQDDAERLDGGLGDGELGQQLGRHPGRRLVAGVQVVAERFDDPVRGAADVGRALLPEQEQELVAQAPTRPTAGSRRDRGPAAAGRSGPGTARRSRRPGGAARWVGGPSRAGSGGRGTRLDELLEADEVGLEDRAEGRRHDQGTEVGEDRRDQQLVPADDRRRAVGPASRVIVPLPLNVPSWLMA